METGKTISGAAQLIFDGVAGMTSVVEGMYRNIAATPFPLGPAPEGPAPGIAGLVYRGIQVANSAARGVTNLALEPLSQHIDRVYPPGPYREAAIAVLNGICGDHLAETGNPLSIPMRFRVYLPTDSDKAAESGADQAPVAFGHLFETHKKGVELYPQAAALQEPAFTATGRVLILAHGLCMNDLEWTSDEHNHGHMLADHYGYTPLFLHYNSGRHISQNGRELAFALEDLLDAWPVPIETVSLLGFSLGGLLFRSALAIAHSENLSWPAKVGKAAYVGTPHHGSALERGGYWLQKSATFSPYTAPLAALGKIRSAGITDLRHGNILDADWVDHDVHEDNGDHRQPTPLAEGITHYTIAATLSEDSRQPDASLRSDGLVHPDSGLGVHADSARQLQFNPDKQYIVYDLGHLSMLHDARVAQQLLSWLSP